MNERDHCREDFSRPSILDQTVDRIILLLARGGALALATTLLWKACSK